MLHAAVNGYLVAISLIAAIGAQNAFVLRQGLRREYVWAVVLVCAASDALLIAAGVAGMGKLSTAAPWFAPLMLWLGVGFLLVYGALRFRAAWAGGAGLVPALGQRTPLRRVIVMCLMFTWANPHVYLDTVVLIGAISAQYAPHQLAFGIAAALGSFSFFFALGFGARFLAPVFARPRAWVVLEACIGVVMWAIAAGLILRGI